MSLSFKDLKPGGVYVTARPNLLWSDDCDYVDIIAEIPQGACFLVIEALGERSHGSGFYRILIDGIVGELIVKNDEVALMDSQ